MLILFDIAFLTVSLIAVTMAVIAVIMFTATIPFAVIAISVVALIAALNKAMLCFEVISKYWLSIFPRYIFVMEPTKCILAQMTRQSVADNNPIQRWPTASNRKMIPIFTI